MRKTLTERSNLKPSHAVRWWGVVGARRYVIALAVLTYVFLAFIGGFGIIVLAQGSDARDRPFITITYITVVFSV